VEDEKAGVMHIPDSKVKASILNPEEEVRVAAVSFFSDSFSPDETVMPLVVQAVERYGRQTAFRTLRSAERLPQVPATVDWLFHELRRDEDLADFDHDNYRFAVALILYHAQPKVLLGRQDAILALPSFPDELRRPLGERWNILTWDWDKAWAALHAFGRDTMREARFTWQDLLLGDSLIESLAGHRATKAPAVLNSLRRQQEGPSSTLRQWIQPWIIRLAGAMQLQSAIPLLVERLSDANVSVADESTTALIKIASDAVVFAVTERWRDADPDFRAAASDVLEHIHTELCAETCLRLFTAEEHLETKLSLAYALLAQFVEQGIEPLRQFILGCDEPLPPDGLDVRHHLVVASAVTGVLFPELQQWHEHAVADNWGLGDYKTPRLADRFRFGTT
jgi:hypothetical protein